MGGRGSFGNATGGGEHTKQMKNVTMRLKNVTMKMKDAMMEHVMTIKMNRDTISKYA